MEVYVLPLAKSIKSNSKQNQKPVKLFSGNYCIVFVCNFSKKDLERNFSLIVQFLAI